MKKLLKKYIIKIPKDISVFYCVNKKILIFWGCLGKKSIILKTKILLFVKKNLIIITRIFLVDKMYNQVKKKLKCFQGIFLALIKQVILELSVFLHNTLKFIGVGFKCFTLNLFKNLLLDLRLGFSHNIYFKVPKQIKIFCIKSTNILIFGNSYQNINQIAALIRSYKTPEFFKGKGIFYSNEKIILKQGKQI